MSLPHKLRYSLARLKPITQPLVWCPVLALVLIGVFAWEQRNHPEWFDKFELGDSSSRSRGQNAPSASEQQAATPDVDSLDALFNELELQPQVTSAIGASNQLAPESTSSTLLSLLQNSRTQAPDLTSGRNPEALSQSSNPFDTYMERYSFIGSRSAPETPQPSFLPLADESSQDDSSSPSLFPNNFLGSSQFESDAQTQPNQLGLALERRPFLNESGQQPQPNQRQDTSEEAAEEALASEGTDASNLNGRQAIIEGNIPDSNLTFIRTIPEMSPPPGTTGYTPPPALNLSPNTLSVGNAFTNLTTPQAAGGSTGIPSLTSGQSGLGNTGGVGVPGSVLPPTTGTQLQPQIEGAQFEPAPFSAPREPGRYVGGGYINTFSNPGAGPED